jgi:photosystem II stability/assembly factor-like uncharacterized protein
VEKEVHLTNNFKAMANFKWKKTNAPTMTNGRTDDIWFSDKNTGWAVNSNGQILSTIDGGHNWTQQLKLKDTYLRCISFSNNTHGWVGTVTSANRLFKTTDGGKNWIKIDNLPKNPSAICGICAVSNNIVFAAGTNYPNKKCAVLHTKDGGNSWVSIDMSEHANLLVDIFFVNETTGWVVGGYGGTTRDAVKPVVLYTEDGGTSWTNQISNLNSELPLGEWGWKIHFVNEKCGYISLENFSAGAILKTTDGGKEWKRIQITDPQKNANIEGIGFLDENTGWVGGWGDKDFNGGYSSFTNDGGASWKNANDIGKYLNRFRFIGNPVEVGYASGDTVYKYSIESEVINPSLQKNKDSRSHFILNQDSEIYTEDVPISLNLPKGTQQYSIEVWDRFGEHIETIAHELNPSSGKKNINWSFPKKQANPNLELQHYILRVNVDEYSESRIVIQANSQKTNFILKSLETYVKENKNTTGVFPTVEQEKEAFFRMANIEDYPDFRPIALELASIYLANADYDASTLFNEFAYNEEDFEKRMKDIYDAVLPDMYKPHRYDQEIISWENGKNYKVGIASDKVAKDRILQMAPFNLMDGFWLQNIMQARPSDEVQSRLFSIWADEAGNGIASQNHSNIYLDLLRSQGYYLPEVTTREFLSIDAAPGAWRSPVFEMCIGLFPQHFFPELLGMTLYLEWEATPTMPPIANMFKGRGINPLFYSLHAAIDNINEGHGALALQAVKIFLEEKREEGGDKAVQENWKRIWNGYVGWATSGSNGIGLEERRLIIDKISINIGTKENPICFPDWKLFYKERMVNLIKRKAPYASKVHGRAALGGVPLNQLFDHPTEFMEKLLESDLINLKHPRQSKFFELLSFDGPMYKVFTDEEKNTMLDWLESISFDTQSCIETIEGSAPTIDNVISIIERLAPMAKRAHDQLTLPDEQGVSQPFISFLDSPKLLLLALIRGGWIIPGSSDRSMFINRVLLNDGPMQGVFSDEEVKCFIDWTDQGAVIPESFLTSKAGISTLKMNVVVGDETTPYVKSRAFIGQGAVH